MRSPLELFDIYVYKCTAIKLQMNTSTIIYQTFKDANSMEKDIENFRFPQRFKITLFRQLPKVQLNTFYEIRVKRDKVLSTMNLHVPGIVMYIIIVVTSSKTLLNLKL